MVSKQLVISRGLPVTTHIASQLPLLMFVKQYSATNCIWVKLSQHQIQKNQSCQGLPKPVIITIMQTYPRKGLLRKFRTTLQISRCLDTNSQQPQPSWTIARNCGPCSPKYWEMDGLPSSCVVMLKLQDLAGSFQMNCELWDLIPKGQPLRVPVLTME